MDCGFFYVLWRVFSGSVCVGWYSAVPVVRGGLFAVPRWVFHGSVGAAGFLLFSTLVFRVSEFLGPPLVSVMEHVAKHMQLGSCPGER